MASILKVDQLQSDSGTVNLASNLAFTGAATFVGNIANPTITGTLNLTGGGIKFPATQISSADANTLDDYEEGTWTPTLTTSGGGSWPITVLQASYIKIGRFVNLTINFYTTGTLSGGGGNVYLGGIPFRSSSDSARSGAFCNYQDLFNTPLGIVVIAASGNARNNFILDLVTSSASSGTTTFSTSVSSSTASGSANKYIQANISYETDY